MHEVQSVISEVKHVGGQLPNHVQALVPARRHDPPEYHPTSHLNCIQNVIPEIQLQGCI